MVPRGRVPWGLCLEFADTRPVKQLYFFFVSYARLQLTPLLVAVPPPPLPSPLLQTATLQHYTQYTVNDLWACVGDVAAAHRAARGSNLHAIFEKYGRPEHGAVAGRFPTLSVDTVEEQKRTLDRVPLPPLVISASASVPKVLNPMSIKAEPRAATQ